LALLASGAIQLFAIEMVFGIVVGAYSCNFLAPSLLFWITKKRDLEHASPVEPIAVDAKEVPAEKTEVEDVEIPKLERKMKGKRQQKK